MKQQELMIDNIPAILLGEESEKLYIFIHGLGGNKKEAIEFAKVAVPKGYQVLGIDLPESGERTDDVQFLPWFVEPELNHVANYVFKRWQHVSVRANSIGAWLSMLFLPESRLEKCLFVSPVLDMEKLILNMMKWASVTEKELEDKKIIETDFSQPLSWQYLLYAREHAIKSWDVNTKVLYAEQDNLTDLATVNAFADRFHCDLSIMQKGEHWFHTPEQLKFLKQWEESHI